MRTANRLGIISGLGLFTLVTGAAAQSAQPAFEIDGPPLGNFGASVDVIGDINGDGNNDYIIGAPDDNNGQGIAVVFTGTQGESPLGFNGFSVGDRLGASVSRAGDVDGDGIEDIVIGAPMADIPSVGPDAGMVILFSGANGSVIHVIPGPFANAQFGTSVSELGDVDNDGFDDVVAGAPGGPIGTSGSDFSEVIVISGMQGVPIMTIQDIQKFSALGTAVSAAGDVNGDGVVDILARAPNATHEALGAGRVMVYSGQDGSELKRHYGSSQNPGFGQAVSALGDFNDDGFDDYLISDPHTDSQTGIGSVRLISGNGHDTVQLLVGTPQSPNFGQSLSAAGDVNGDGVVDFAVGSPSPPFGFPNFQPGIVQIYSAHDVSLIQELQGETDGDTFGTAVAGGGDINGDGLDDVWIGSPLAKPTTDQGKGILYASSCQTDLGFGGPGDLQLSLCAPLGALEAEFRLSGGLPFAQGVLLVSLFSNPTFAPEIGATFVPLPPQATFGFSTDENGSFVVPGVPLGIPAGPLTVYVQGAVDDPNQQGGYAVSNAIQFDTL